MHQHRLHSNDFIRERKLSFPNLMLFFLNFRKGASQQELDQFFPLLTSQNAAQQMVTKSAFTQARTKLSAGAFSELNHIVIQQFYQQYSEYQTWNGFRLCAIDGTMLRLPNEKAIVEHFGIHNGRQSQKDCPMALASVYYDVLNQIVIDAQLAPIHTSERDCATQHLQQAKSNDLVLFDRGYPAFWLYQHLQQQGQSFCMRVKSNLDKVNRQFLKSRKSQMLIDIEPTKIARSQCEEKGLLTTPIRLRLIRVKLKKETEVLITNLLDDERYPSSIFKDLYHQRWGIEENFKRQKQWLAIEHFSGKSALSVQQDFHAKIVSLNLTAMMLCVGQQHVDEQTKLRKHRYKINFAQALSKMKNKIVTFLLNVTHSDYWHRLRKQMLYLTDTVDALRRNRSYPRKLSNLHHNINHLCYKGCR